MTCDTWQMTHDMWQVGGGEPSLKMLSPYITVWERRCFEDIFLQRNNKYWINWIISDKGVCRAAPSTPGLLIVNPDINPTLNHFKSL